MNLGSGLEGKRVLVTGASSGLGNHFAKICASCGAHVAVAARRRERLDTLVSDIEAAGKGSADAFALDVTDQTSIERCVERVTDHFGGIDVLVNNAGVSGAGGALDQPKEIFDQVIDTNLRGVWKMAIETATVMRNQGVQGSIVNIASILGFRQANGLSAYAVSKAGVVQMTKALALEWARFGIRVNAIAPGYFETEINDGYFDTEQGEQMLRRVPMRRVGHMVELNGPFLLLATGASAYMTGSVLTVDGGHLVSSL